MARAMWLNCRSCLQNFDNGKESQNTSVLLKQMPTTLLPLLDPVEVILEKCFKVKKYVFLPQTQSYDNPKTVKCLAIDSFKIRKMFL